MNPCQQLHDLGQSLWLDNITRDLLDAGTLREYIDRYSVTGLTSNPTIFDEAIGKSSAYDHSIGERARQGKTAEPLFIEVALEDLRRAADLFSAVHDATKGIDGWVSMEVSPLLANDTAGSIQAAEHIFESAGRKNLFVKIPGTPAGVPAIEEAIFRGIPINVTLLFSREQYLAAAEAYLRGIERRIAAGRDPHVTSVASVFVSRWDKAVSETAPASLRNQLGIAISGRVYQSYLELLASARWQKLVVAGAKPQRLLWASTGTKDPALSETFYVEALAAPDTINTMPEKTLKALAAQGKIASPMAADGSASEAILKQFAAAKIDIDKIAADLQREGAESFVKSWRQLMERVETKMRTARSA